MPMETTIPLKRENDEDNRSSIQKAHQASAKIIEEVSVTVSTLPTPDSRSKKMHVSSSKDKSSVKNLIPRLSFKSRAPSMESERHIAQTLESGGSENTIISRTLSFKNLFKPAVRRTFSLPVRNDALLSDDSLQGATSADSQTLPPSNTKGIEKNISRSLSAPLNKKFEGIKRMASSGNGFRVIPSSPKAADTSISAPYPLNNNDNVIDGEGEDIPEDEAVCRICMIELTEGGDTMKFECDCKGELSLAHQECAVKWFSLKGNRNCEVCKQEVQNLSVTLLRIELVPVSNAGNESHQANLQPLRLFLDMPALVIISMLLYFCFLEQIFVFDSGYAALPVSLPLSCFLGIGSSMTASTMVKGKYVWAYASIQFVLVVFFAHLFYREIHMKPMISIIIATFAGFGITMSGSSVALELWRWRQRARTDGRNSENIPMSTHSSQV